jgi:hypothetical protein
MSRVVSSVKSGPGYRSRVLHSGAETSKLEETQ